MDQEFYKSILDESPTAYSYQKIILDDEGNSCDFEFIEVNPAFEKLHGLKSCEVVGKKGTEVFAGIEKDPFDWINFYGDIAINEKSIVIRQYSEYIHLWLDMKVYSPKKYYFIVRYHDITKEMSQELEIEIEEIIFNGTQDALFLVSVEEGPSFVYLKNNSSHQEKTGLMPDHLYGKTPIDLLGIENGSIIEEKFNHCVKEGKPISYEDTLALNGDIRTWKTTLTPIFSYHKPTYIVGSSRDITMEKQKIEAIKYLIFHDPLTGLYNRAFYEEELKRIDTLRNLPLTIVMADVNDLKLINDAFGHVLGDKLLQKVAEVIQSCCREDEIIARLGGDEFIILLPGVDADSAKKIIKRIREICAKTYLSSLPLSISFGWETKIDINDDIFEIQKRAEDRMYRRKLFESTNRREEPLNFMIQTLYKAYDYEESHSKRVSKLSEAMGKALHFQPVDLDELTKAAQLHDIGKVGVNYHILNKTGPLTPEEWRVVQRHPEIGYRILSSVNGLSNVADYVLAHHEHFDGSGYPKGLKGAMIPIQSRIITLVNTYDALTSHRPYHKAITNEEAIKYIKNNNGEIFDPMLVEVFINLDINKLQEYS